jgi:hypothetical protein
MRRALALIGPAVIAFLAVACATGPTLLTGRATAPAGEVHGCISAALEARGYEIHHSDAQAGTISARREKFDDEPMFDAVEARITETADGRWIEIRAEEIRLTRVAPPSELTVRDAEIVLAACAG